MNKQAGGDANWHTERLEEVDYVHGLSGSISQIFMPSPGNVQAGPAVPLIINFCVAYLTASREVLLNIFNDPDAFVSDAAFLFLLASLTVFIFGPGAFSVDAILKKIFAAPRKQEAIPAAPMAAGGRQEALQGLP